VTTASGTVAPLRDRLLDLRREVIDALVAGPLDPGHLQLLATVHQAVQALALAEREGQ
jgi:hypothetical protein